MVESEREMLRGQVEDTKPAESTSLQRTYEDSIPPDDNDWEFEQD